ncbi:hypothetical protein V6N13_039418 [Hibiscus sabdariffa]
MGEMLLGKFKGEFPLVIIRPSMITSTYKQPFPGWIEGLRTIDSVIMSYGKGRLTCFPGNLNSALDVVLYLVNILSAQRLKKVYTKHDRKIKFIIRLAQLYKPYVFFKGIFDGRNLEKLEKVAEERGIEVAEFDFNSKNIDWEDYIMDIHIPSLLKHEFVHENHICGHSRAPKTNKLSDLVIPRILDFRN